MTLNLSFLQSHDFFSEFFTFINFGPLTWDYHRELKTKYVEKKLILGKYLKKTWFWVALTLLLSKLSIREVARGEEWGFEVLTPPILEKLFILKDFLRENPPFPSKNFWLRPWVNQGKSLKIIGDMVHPHLQCPQN